MSKGQGKLLTKKLIKVHKQNTNRGIFLRAYLGWSIETCVSKSSFYCISLYLFIAILCAKMSRMNKALMILSQLQ